MTKLVSTLALGSALCLSAACASGGSDSRRAGTPDEFRVVKKAPLTVPPEYSLRPPRAGVSVPAEVDPARAERAISFGEQSGIDASAAERMLVAKAGAIAVNPIIREQVDYEEAGFLRKSRRVSGSVTDWSGTEEERALAQGDNATGGGDVIIERGSGRRIKLPGT
ncbi:MAG: DUF3035 domain-containing protein [Pseudomonadota bacterium]